MGAASLAIAAVAAVWLGAPVAVCTVLGVPLVLLAPGYVWTEVFFGSRLGAEQRAVLSVALSLTITALGGVLLSVGGLRLDSSSWLALLAGTTLAGAAVATTVRARAQNVPSASPVERHHIQRHHIQRHHIQRHHIQRMSRAQGVRLAFSGLLGAAALGVAVYSANAQAQPPFTQLSLSQHGAAPTTAEVVLVNHEQGARHYRLVVSTDGAGSKSWMVTLAEGTSWQRSVPARPGHRLAVDVYRTLEGGKPYRHVTLIVPVVGAK